MRLWRDGAAVSFPSLAVPSCSLCRHCPMLLVVVTLRNSAGLSKQRVWRSSDAQQCLFKRGRKLCLQRNDVRSFLCREEKVKVGERECKVYIRRRQGHSFIHSSRSFVEITTSPSKLLCVCALQCCWNCWVLKVGGDEAIVTL